MTDHPVVQVGNVVAAGFTLSSLLGWLPPTAAALGILWYGVLFYDRFWKKK